ncbi:MAG: NADH-ubiquinone oxidoreductase-F iron-sulfur binding region domain-containing protein, partial [Acidimicrobiia bacterium]
SRGTRLFSVSGHVERPGNYEIVMGMTWRDLIYDLGGGVRDGKALKCWIPGGASAPWLTPEHVDEPITIQACTRLGTMLGSGGIVVMDETTNVVAAALSLVRFFAHESCGQCTPCREGTSWLERILERILHGRGRMSDLDLLLDVSDNISPGLRWPPAMTTICPLGPSAVSPITSIMANFRDEVVAMIAGEVPAGV